MKALILSLIAGFTSVYIGIPYAKKYLLASGIYGIDQQKQGKPKIPTSGGLPVLFGFILSVTLYMGLTAITQTNTQLTSLLAALCSVNMIAIIGLVDDIHIDLEEMIKDETGQPKFELELKQKIKQIQTPHRIIHDKVTRIIGEKQENQDEMHRKGLNQATKMLFVFPALLPLIAIGAGSWTMTIPIINQTINWGIIYPLILMPGGFFFVTNSVNMLAGTNGLSTGLATVTSASIGIFALINGRTVAAVISLSLASTSTAFLVYNKHPSSILPGDSYTYLAGAAIFSSVVIGNLEKFGASLFLIYIIEFLLKARAKFNAHSWGILQPDGTIKSQYNKIYSITHIFMNKNQTEKQITTSIIAIQAIWCLTQIYIHTNLL